jgi:CRP-like cAMP-binding protein
VTPDLGELRSLFLFASLDDEQVKELAQHATMRTYGARTVLARQGRPVEHLFVLVEGSVRLRRRVAGREVVVAESARPGVYGGSFQPGIYRDTFETTGPSRVVRVPAHDFACLLRRWSPIAAHLLSGVLDGLLPTELRAHEAQCAAGLDELSAVIADRINDPASAAVVAARQARDGSTRLRRSLVGLPASMCARALYDLGAVTERLLDHPTADDTADGSRRAAVERLRGLLEDCGVDGASGFAAVLSSRCPGAGWVDDLERLIVPLEARGRSGAVRWLVEAVELDETTRDLTTAAERISELASGLRRAEPHPNGARFPAPRVPDRAGGTT